ncbi:MAG: hypothetical protein ACLFR1_14730 [Spirochaetia bacterium]
MGDSFEAQKHYFQVQIEQAKDKPYLHKNIIEDCKHYLQILEETGSPAAFKKHVQKTGNMLSSGKANVRDRYENRLALYQTLGSQKKAEADKIRLQVIDEASTHQELAQALEDIEASTRPLEQQENKATMAASQIIKAVFHLATDPPGSEAERRSATNFREYWKQLKEADPEISWEKLTTYRPYRNRMIFTDKQLSALKQVFQEVQNGS